MSTKTEPLDRMGRSTGRWLVKRWLATVAVILGLTATVATIVGALLTDNPSVSANSFTAVTVIIDGTPTAAAFNVPSLYPGDSEVMELTVANAGTADFRYAVTSVTTEDTLASELTLTIRVGVTTCDVSDWNATGSQLYQGKLGDTTTPGGHPLIGDATTGADAGDRALAATASEKLCFHVELPVSATNQNVSTTATFNFVAEQTANN